VIDTRATRLRAVGLAAVGFGLYSLSDMLMKWLTGTFPLPQTLFANALFSLLPITVAALSGGGRAALATRRPRLQLLRGLLGLMGGTCAVFAFVHMGMTEVYAILFAAPMIITILSIVVYGEKVGVRRWSAIIVGFAGVMIMLKPGGGEFNVGVFGALGCLFSYACSVLIYRHHGAGETAFSFSFYGSLTTVVLLLPVLPFILVPMRWDQAAFLAAAGCVAGCATMAQTEAFRSAPSSLVAPFQYTQMIWGALLGYLMFGDVPTWSLVAGASLVVASGVYIIRREAAVQAERGSGPADQNAG